MPKMFIFIYVILKWKTFYWVCRPNVLLILASMYDLQQMIDLCAIELDKLDMKLVKINHR